jgi:hypothetical protein
VRVQRNIGQVARRSKRVLAFALAVTAVRSPRCRKEIAHRELQSWSCAGQQRAVETCLESRKVYPIHLQIGTLSSGDGREDLCGDHRSFTPSVSMKPNSHVKSRRAMIPFPCACATPALSKYRPSGSPRATARIPPFVPSFGRFLFHHPQRHSTC